MTFATLMYHELREASGFDPERPSPIDVKQNYADVLPAPLFVTVERFAGQMAFLHEQGYHTLTLQEVRRYYEDGQPLPERSVLLTFDDCFQSVKAYAWPILKQYGFRATAFAVTGWLHDEPRPFDPSRSACLAASELAAMTDVFEFANHTDLMHRRSGPRSSDLTALSDEELEADLMRCNSHPCIQAQDVFAYPFGLYEERNQSVLKRLGFKLAFTAEPGRNGRDSDPLLLRRYAVPYTMDLERFAHLVESETRES